MTGPEAGPRPGTLGETVAGLEEAVAERLRVALGTPAVEVATPPRTALVMMDVTDPFDTTFHLGEVLVTEAGVRSGDATGWGVATGDSPQRALLAAVIDLLERTADRVGLERAAALLAPEAARLAARRAREAELVGRTQVKFDLMPGRGG